MMELRRGTTVTIITGLSNNTETGSLKKEKIRIRNNLNQYFIKMEYVYIGMKGDKEVITEKVKRFEDNSNESLIDAYNNQSKIGITGVRGQVLYLMALGHIFFKRFGESPIYMENNVLGMKGQIKLSGDTFEYIE
jgi:hypothetical protein